jgi:hypothetical protein
METEHTIELLKPCNKEVKTSIWESFFIHALQKQNLLIEEHKVNDPDPLFEHKMLHYITRYQLSVPLYS